MDDEDVRTLLAEIEELGAEVAELLAEKARILGELAAKIEEAIDLAKENDAPQDAPAPPVERCSSERPVS